MSRKQDHLSKSIDAILSANSQEEVKSIIDSAVSDFDKNDIGKKELAAFVGDATKTLELLNPLNKTPLQWSNIKMARIHLNKLKRYPSPIAAGV